MAEINLPEVAERKSGFFRGKNHSLRIDMTPMVDLGFLLIAFFIYATRLSEPAALELRMPAETKVDSSNLPESMALSILLAEHNRVFYYQGSFEKAIQSNRVSESSFSYRDGIGTGIRQRQEEIDRSGKFPEGRKGLMLLIKPTKEASYKNTVDALDEALINDVRKYAIVEPSQEELHYISRLKNVQGFNSNK